MYMACAARPPSAGGSCTLTTSCILQPHHQQYHQQLACDEYTQHSCCQYDLALLRCTSCSFVSVRTHKMLCSCYAVWAQIQLLMWQAPHKTSNVKQQGAARGGVWQVIPQLSFWLLLRRSTPQHAELLMNLLRTLLESCLRQVHQLQSTANSRYSRACARKFIRRVRLCAQRVVT
jgi:hypothetical protein